MRNPIAILVLLILIAFMGCETGDDPNPLIPQPPEPPEFEPDDPDPEGNLVIRNMSDQVLILYARGERKKVLPASSDDFLVNIPNAGGTVADLWLFKVVDAQDNPDNPDLALVFKRWSVVLSSDNEIEHRVTWLVNGSETESINGTLILNYFGGVDESVDVMLNNRTGAKLASLRPGQQDKRVGLDYGNYAILYRYWISDQNSPDGEEELGWIDKENVNGEEVAIFLILNDSRNNRHIQVPHWNNGNLPETQYGNIQIKNDTAQPVQIWVGSDLIEDVMYTDRPIQNRSTIAANDIEVFTMPVIESEYTFIARYLSNGMEISRRSIGIVPDSSIYWEITTDPPSQVENLLGEAISSSKINLSWQIPTTNEDGFYIERSSDGNEWIQIDDTPGRILSYSDITVTGNETFWYRISAYNSIGNGDPSDPVVVATLLGPDNLEAVAPSMTEVELTWSDNAEGENGFKIERHDDNSDWTELGIHVGANQARFLDSGLSSGTNYYYRVRAFNSTGHSDYSEESSVVTPGPPAQPTNPSIEILSATELKVKWVDNSGNEDGFEIERKTGAGGEWFRISTTSPDVESFTDSDLTRSTTYFYRIRAFNALGGYSDYSDEVSATTPDVPPSAPGNLAVEAASAYQINLTWEDRSDNEVGFELERRTGAQSEWNLVADIEANSVHYEDQGLLPNTAYSYRLRAYNAVDFSDYSNEAATSTPDVAPRAPSDLQAVAVSSIQIDLVWADNSTNEVGFIVERSIDNNYWEAIGSTGTNVVEYQDNPLESNTVYYYRVFAYNGIGNSDISNVSFARTRFAGLVAFVADGVDGLQIIDVTITENPQIIGSVDTPAEAYGVDVAGDYAYVADRLGGIRVIDVSNPVDPREVGVYDSPGEAMNVTIAGELAFVADKDAGLRILNLVDPENPVETGFYDSPGQAWDVAVQGSIAYLADRHFGLRVVDVSNPQAPQEIGAVDTPGMAYGIDISDQYAYIADDSNNNDRLRVINISNPDSPYEVSSILLESETRDVVVRGNTAYTNMGSVVMTVDISNPEELSYGEWALRTPSLINDLTISGNYIYVSCTDRGLEIADITDIPISAGYIDTPGSAQNCKVVEYR